ncbi:MAG TPA: hypothetical protein VGB38_08760, partial [bacterium]
GEVVIKAVNAAGNKLKVIIDLQRAGRIGRMAKVILLTAALTDENSLLEPKKVYPQERSIPIGGRRFAYEFQPFSLTVLRVPVK